MTILCVICIPKFHFMRYCLLAISLLIFNFAKSQTDYFQQEVKYQIEVSLNDKSHLLAGFEQFEYINNSPDTLNEILLHLWPNAYKNSKTAMAKQKFRDGDYFMLWAPQKDRGYIDSLDFKINNPADANIAKSPAATIYAMIDADLAAAEQGLPNTWEAKFTGRLTTWAAKTLRA